MGLIKTSIPHHTAASHTHHTRSKLTISCSSREEKDWRIPAQSRGDVNTVLGRDWTSIFTCLIIFLLARKKKKRKWGVV